MPNKNKQIKSDVTESTSLDELEQHISLEEHKLEIEERKERLRKTKLLNYEKACQLEVLKKIRSMSYMATQQEQAIQREQRTKKAKKVYSKTIDLVSGYQEQNLENKLIIDEMQTTTIVRKNNESSIEDPILKAKAKTDKSKTTTNVRTNEKTCMEIEIEESEKKDPDHKKQQQELLESSMFDIEDPSSENTYLTSEMLIDKPGLSTVRNNNRDTKQINKGKVVQPISYSKAVKGTTKNRYTFISSD
ncbi:26850_t:CDS:2 [Gigaspora margarita]|uniref:26850_t:CDS:1 n=1 Tax=Gigaspora margarita TaxID=4874 RepID=A0ABN7URK9_GIGMA|nr:26850_t:CDS:2 [Gigaspora margarita]